MNLRDQLRALVDKGEAEANAEKQRREDRENKPPTPQEMQQLMTDASDKLMKAAAGRETMLRLDYQRAGEAMAMRDYLTSQGLDVHSNPDMPRFIVAKWNRPDSCVRKDESE